MVDIAIQFSDGQTSCGYEKPHPKTTSDVVKGKAFGDIRGNKEIGFKGVIWPLEGGGAHVEGYIDLQDGKGWQLGISADNIGEKKFEKDPNQQVQFRIDAAPSEGKRRNSRGDFRASAKCRLTCKPPQHPQHSHL